MKKAPPKLKKPGKAKPGKAKLAPSPPPPAAPAPPIRGEGWGWTAEARAEGVQRLHGAQRWFAGAADSYQFAPPAEQAHRPRLLAIGRILKAALLAHLVDDQEALGKLEGAAKAYLEGAGERRVCSPDAAAWREAERAHKPRAIIPLPDDPKAPHSPALIAQSRTPRAPVHRPPKGAIILRGGDLAPSMAESKARLRGIVERRLSGDVRAELREVRALAADLAVLIVGAALEDGVVRAKLPIDLDEDGAELLGKVAIERVLRNLDTSTKTRTQTAEAMVRAVLRDLGYPSAELHAFFDVVHKVKRPATT